MSYPANIVQLTMVGSIHGQETNNVMHFKPTSEAQPLIDLALAFLICLRTNLLPGLSNEWKLKEMRVKQVWPTVGDEVISPAISTDSGGLVTQALPSTNAAVISFRTGMGGRSKRGRMYIAGVPEAGSSNSVVTDPTLAALLAFVACLANKFVGESAETNWRQVVTSRKLAAAASNNLDAGSTLLTTYQVQTVLGTMRSRRIGHGR